jgi:uncharacterized membrane protein
MSIMSLTPLLTASPAIQIHAFSATLALVLGAFVLFRPKGTPVHKRLGRLWAVLMLIVATSALFINEIRLIGPFSPIHLFSLATYLTLAQGIWHIRHGNVVAHRKAMTTLYFGALILAGAFTLLPGRRMYALIFGSAENPFYGFVLVGIVVVTGLVVWRRIDERPHRA